MVCFLLILRIVGTRKPHYPRLQVVLWRMIALLDLLALHSPAHPGSTPPHTIAEAGHGSGFRV